MHEHHVSSIPVSFLYHSSNASHVSEILHPTMYISRYSRTAVSDTWSFLFPWTTMCIRRTSILLLIIRGFLWWCKWIEWYTRKRFGVLIVLRFFFANPKVGTPFIPRLTIFSYFSRKSLRINTRIVTFQHLKIQENFFFQTK